MTINEAEKIVYAYSLLFDKGSYPNYEASRINHEIDRKSVREESLLPYSKNMIKTACKVYVAYHGAFKQVSKEEMDIVFMNAKVLSSFLPDSEVAYLRKIRRKMQRRSKWNKKIFTFLKIYNMQAEIQYYSQYLQKIIVSELHDEMVKILYEADDFYRESFSDNELPDIREEGYYKYVYENIIGIEYKHEYGVSFCNKLSEYYEFKRMFEESQYSD